MRDYPERFEIRIVGCDLSKFDCRHPVFGTQYLTLEDMPYWFLAATAMSRELAQELQEGTPASMTRRSSRKSVGVS